MGIASPASAHFALDVKSLAALKRSASRDPQAHAREATQQFEALFLGRLMHSMRSAGFHSDLLGDRQLRFYRSLLDRQLAQIMAERGTGLGDMLMRQLGDQGAARANEALRTTALDLTATPFAQVPGGYPQRVSGMTSAAASARGDSAGNRDERFVHRFADAARAAAKLSGVSPLLVLAQAALETGWGRERIETDDGRDSHNLFAIKTGGGWEGASTAVATHEHVAGQRQFVQARFRVYDSYRDAFADHVRLIGHGTRYAAVRAANGPVAQARALQDCGYATDPHYADKLIAIMQRISDIVL